MNFSLGHDRFNVSLLFADLAPAISTEPYPPVGFLGNPADAAEPDVPDASFLCS